MSQVAEPSAETAPDGATARPPALPRHLKWLVAVAVVLTGLVVYSVVETLDTSSAANSVKNLTTVGFFAPRTATPVSFSLPPLAVARGQANVTMSSLTGKPLVINLWSTTCAVCVQETPAIESVAREVGSQVRFVGIDTLDSTGPARSFVKHYGVTYLELFDATGSVANGYSTPGLPVSIFVTAEGKVVGENLGALTTTS
ncbi:MAG TPA: TlpA disulfide reductase family protein, partial [Acidimicrobiales bacterium]|nr:TlpA disulfide reductase family protein [Acidimicrobiales bacterium]